MSLVSSLPVVLDLTPRIKWTAAHESSICRDYPFTDLTHETPEQYVARTYLQFLWLPESIMPLNLLVPSLKRVQVASTSTSSSHSPHPLHALLNPLLLTARTAANKFQIELPQILNDGGGAGDVEETMMWYVLEYEKGSDENNERERSRSNTGGSEQSGHSSEFALLNDEKWKSRWLRRMERREVQIQILLHLLTLSLPGPPPAVPESPEMSSVKRRKRPRKKVAPAPTAEDRLEGFMDKLSMWQLMGDLEPNETRPPKAKHELDWMQLFFRNVVEPLFGKTLSTFCELLRSKIFPNSPFSDDEEDENENEDSKPSRRSKSASTSPPPGHPRKRARTSTTSSDRLSNPPTRYPSPALSTTSSSSHNQRAKLERSRSRSLSVSLAEDAEQQRKAAEKAALAGAKKRGVISREVSMSRVFKSKNKTMSSSTTTATSSVSSFLVSDSRQRVPETKSTKNESKKGEGVTLVEATPVKPIRTASLSMVRTQSSSSQLQSADSSVFGEGSQQSRGQKPLFPRTLSALSAVGEEEEIWDLPGSSSPDVLLLTPSGSVNGTKGLVDGGADDSDEEGIWAVSTPTKAGRRRGSIRPP